MSENSRNVANVQKDLWDNLKFEISELSEANYSEEALLRVEKAAKALRYFMNVIDYATSVEIPV
jgi:hypothetical protein